jgi:uncharacterized protein YcbK (DUF882 family)
VRRLLALVCALAGPASAGVPPRFFVAGDGRLALVHAHTGARVDVRYRRADGTYDPAAVAAIRRALRSGDDAGDGKAALRLIELLSRVQQMAGGGALRIQSGYRSPAYNDAIRRQGARAAGASLHTEGLAADVALPRPRLRPLWLALRGLDCCGVGYYAADGFLHVDAGRPRFWEAATSRVDENLSAGNARVFARTEFDRYAAGEAIVVRVHALTVPPLRVASTVALVDARGTRHTLDVAGADGAGCVPLAASGAALELRGAPAGTRGRLVLATCAPRVEQTPATVESNPIAVR